VVIGGSYFENLPELGHSHQSVGFTSYTNMSLLPCVHVASVCSYIIVFTLAASWLTVWCWMAVVWAGMEILLMQHDVLECFETVITKGDEARFRLYEVRSKLIHCRFFYSVWLCCWCCCGFIKLAAVNHELNTSCEVKIRYRIFIVRSKTNNSQLNLPHSTITEKNNAKKLKNEKSQKYRKQTGSHGVSPTEREKSLWWEWLEKKIGYKQGVKERRKLWKIKEEEMEMTEVEREREESEVLLLLHCLPTHFCRN